MSYTRVIPRDLFNEAKLLKCLGQLALLIHDGKAGNLKVKHRRPDKGFVVHQDPSSGGLYCYNLRFTLNKVEVEVATNYNSKAPYPLGYCFNDEYGEVFNDDGSFTDEFKALVGA